MESINGFLETR